MPLELPDFTDPLQAADASRYKANIDAAAAAHEPIANAFRAYEAATPAMSVVVSPGIVQGGIIIIPKTAQTVAITAAHATLPRIDRIVLDTAGVASVITGTPAGSPTVPAITVSKTGICQVLVGATVTSILDSNITDERSFKISRQRLVPLATPLSIVTASATLGAWTTYNAASNILKTQGAVAAKIRVSTSASFNPATFIRTRAYVRPTGSGLAAAGNPLTMIIDQIRSELPPGTTLTTSGLVEVDVQLDGNNEFDWQHDTGGSTTSSATATIILMGYYIEE